MKDSEWLNPFFDFDMPRKTHAPEVPMTPGTWTAEDRAASRARLHELIAHVMKPYRPQPQATPPDPEAALMALFAAHETDVYDAAVAARQRLASRQAAWRLGRALDGQPVA